MDGGVSDITQSLTNSVYTRIHPWCMVIYMSTEQTTRRKPMLAADGCTTHRDRCIFGKQHTWSFGGRIETDEQGKFLRVGYGEYRRDLFWCYRCNQVCYVVDDVI